MIDNFAKVDDYMEKFVKQKSMNQRVVNLLRHPNFSLEVLQLATLV